MMDTIGCLYLNCNLGFDQTSIFFRNDEDMRLYGTQHHNDSVFYWCM